MEESASILNLGDVEINLFFKDLIPKRKENLYVNRSSYLFYQLHNNVWSFIAGKRSLIVKIYSFFIVGVDMISCLVKKFLEECVLEREENLFTY